MDISPLMEQYPSLVPVLRLLPPATQTASQLVTFSLGQTIAFRDAPVEYAYLLLEGEVNVYNITYEGKYSTWMIMTAPVVISDLEMLSGNQRYAANVGAATSCTALQMDVSAFVRSMRKNIELLWFVSSGMAKKTFVSSHNRGYSVSCSSLEKTVIYLLQQCAQNPPATDAPTIIQKTRPQIASEIGVSLKTLERCVNQLRDQNSVSIIRGKIHISTEQFHHIEHAWVFHD